MKKYIYLFLASVVFISFSSCEESYVEGTGIPFASFISNTMDLGVDAGSEITQELKIYTTNISDSDRNISVIVDEDATNANLGAYSVPATVTIPGGSNEGSLMVAVKDIELTVFEDKELVLRLGYTDQLKTGTPLTIALSQNCPDNGIKLRINLTFDSYPDEAAWIILDSDGGSVLQSITPFNYGAYTGMSGTTTIKDCLATGTYTIKIYDKYSDGGTKYKITGNGTEVFSLKDKAYKGYYEGTFTI